MSRTRDQRRAALIDPIADHLLAHGVAASNLRALAQAAGTSDRMLLYYFADRDDLLAAAFARIRARLDAALRDGAPTVRLPADRLTETVWALASQDALRPTMELLLDVMVRAGREGGVFADAAQAATTQFVDWLADRLDIADAADRRRQALRVLATIDGLILLRAADPNGFADADAP